MLERISAGAQTILMPRDPLEKQRDPVLVGPRHKILRESQSQDSYCYLHAARDWPAVLHASKRPPGADHEALDEVPVL